MAIINADGLAISHDSEELIAELKSDIAEFGDIDVFVWIEKIEGVDICVNYDFIQEEIPLTTDELKEGEFIEKMKSKDLLKRLIKQNEIL